MSDNGHMPPDAPRWNVEVADKLAEVPFFIQRHERHRRTSFHRQPGVEIHITHEGRATFLAGNRMLLQIPRQVVVHRGEIAHQMIADASKPYSRTVVCIDTARLQFDTALPFMAELHFDWVSKEEAYNFQLDVRHYARIEQLCEAMELELSERRIGWQRMAFAYLTELTVHLQRAADAERLQLQEEGKYTAVSRLVQDCVDFVSQRLEEGLSLSATADRFGVSPEHLTRLFRKELGVPFHQFILLQRIAEAKRLLCEFPDRPITDIALQVGFPTASHFGNTFRSIAQESPTGYRRKMLGAE